MKKFLFTCLSVCLFSFMLNAQQTIIPTPFYSSINTTKSYQVYRNIPVKSEGDISQSLLRDMKEFLGSKTLRVNSIQGEIKIELDEAMKTPSSFSMEVSAEGIRISGADAEGLYYGVNTLKQMIQRQKGLLSFCTINDHPRFAWRGFLLDESRHFFGKKKVLQYLDCMAQLKLNVFHWHLTDETGWRIEIKKYPKLTTEGAIGDYSNPTKPAQFYTQEEIKEIVAYAQARHIMILPEFDMPGHATSVCRSYPQVSSGGEGKRADFAFQPCKEETYELISNIMDELFELFPAPYIHIGGDEVRFGNQTWFTDPQIQAFIKQNDLKDERGLEQYFIRRIVKLVASKGKKVIGWDEIIDANAPTEEVVIMWWRHDRKAELVKALERGYQVILTPRRPLYGDFNQFETHRLGRNWGGYASGYNPIASIVAFPESIESYFKEYEDQVMGIQYSMWTERIDNADRLDYMTFPRLVAVAESAWASPKQKDLSQFMHKLYQFLPCLDARKITYFNPFDPKQTPEIK
ncbi:MAG: beta-N-acetylhexosaminidase [Massilibacteroides sp.]|nr:beta-N-acetylhexosaminidase [Massilibacteroides sp.]